MSLEDLLSADVVSVHVPLLSSTRELIGEAEFRRMKLTAYFINAARGLVVDQAALARALKEGPCPILRKQENSLEDSREITMPSVREL